MEKIIITDAVHGAKEIADVKGLNIIQGQDRGNNAIELENGVWLRDVDDGRLYDDEENLYATVETMEYDGGGELIATTKFWGYTRV